MGNSPAYLCIRLKLDWIMEKGAICVYGAFKWNSLQTSHYQFSSTSDLVTQWDFHIPCHSTHKLWLLQTQMLERDLSF